MIKNKAFTIVTSTNYSHIKTALYLYFIMTLYLYHPKKRRITKASTALHVTEKKR